MLQTRTYLIFITYIYSSIYFLQVKITAQAFHDKPLLIIDNFRIIPPLRKFTTTTSESSSVAVAKPTPKPSLVDIFREKVTENTSQAISTGTSKESTIRAISTGTSKKNTSRAVSTETSTEQKQINFTSTKLLNRTKTPQQFKPTVVFKLRKGSKGINASDEYDKKRIHGVKDEMVDESPREHLSYLTRSENASTTPKVNPDHKFIDETTGTTVTFWTYLAIVSLVLALLLFILIIIVNVHLVRKNCV